MTPASVLYRGTLLYVVAAIGEELAVGLAEVRVVRSLEPLGDAVSVPRHHFVAEPPHHPAGQKARLVSAAGADMAAGDS